MNKKSKLTPLLPSVNRTLKAIFTDLEDLGLLDSTFTLMMGELGRNTTSIRTTDTIAGRA
jgi:hypothetical protein